jgi:hypothetical protein
LLLALSLILPSLGIRFGPPPSNPPSEELARRVWLWIQSAYTSSLIRPIAALLLFFIISMVTIVVNGSTSPLVGPFSIDKATLVFAALLLPFVSLMGWSLSLSREALAVLLRARPPLQFRGRLTLLTTLAAFTWGALIQVSYATGRLLAWIICCSLVSMLLAVLWKLGGKAPQNLESIQVPPLPKQNTQLVVLQILILFLACTIYSTLALLTK